MYSLSSAFKVIVLVILLSLDFSVNVTDVGLLLFVLLLSSHTFVAICSIYTFSSVTTVSSIGVVVGYLGSLESELFTLLQYKLFVTLSLITPSLSGVLSLLITFAV